MKQLPVTDRTAQYMSQYTSTTPHLHIYTSLGVLSRSSAISLFLLGSSELKSSQRSPSIVLYLDMRGVSANDYASEGHSAMRCLCANTMYANPTFTGR